MPLDGLIFQQDWPKEPTRGCPDEGSGGFEEARTNLKLGDEFFLGWREAKTRVQQIMVLRSGGRPVPEDELRLLLDVFHLHPNATNKRVSEVTAVTVGSSEKFKGTPAFWLWRQDGTSEDISVNKCWKKLDLADKASKKEGRFRQKSDPVMAGERFYGNLLSWHFENGKSYGYVRLHDLEASLREAIRVNGDHLGRGQKLYLS